MAEEDTPAAAPALDYSQLPALMEKYGLTPPAPPQLPSSPGQGGVAGFLGDVGKVLAGGGSGLLDLPPGESDKAGAHALLNMGINMLMASGPSYVPRGLGEIIGYGLQGAQEGYQGSELAVAQRLAAQQAGQQQQFTNRMEAIKAALPLLQLQQRASLPNPFAQGGGGGKPNTSIAAAIPAYGGASNPPPMPKEYEDYFQAASKATGIPVEVLKAQAAQESGFNPGATGAAGEIGIMQIHPDTAKNPGFGLEGVRNPAELRDPATNIMFGAKYLAARGKGQDFTTPQGQAAALTAYNGGGDPNYVRNVFRYMPAGGMQVAAATPPPAASGGGTAAPAPGRVQVATATPTTATDGTTAAPAAPTAPGQARDITNLKDEELSLPEYQQRYRSPIAPDAGKVPVDPQVLADRQTALTAAQKEFADADKQRQAAEQTYTNTMAQGKDPASALQARGAAIERYNATQQALQTAQQNASKLVQDAATASVANRQTLQTEQDKQLAAAYKDMQDRRAQAALETQKGQQQENIEKIKAGQTFHMQQEEEAAKQTNTNTIAPMAAQAIKAHELNLGLSQLQTVLPNLPKGGGTVGYLLDHHPDLLPLLNQAGVVTDRQADATRLLTGLTAGLSTAMKPTGLGALREYEFDAFKAQLPNLLSTPEGQQKALAYLMNLNDRVQKEAQWTQQHYNRRIPDEMSQKPGATRRALNLDTEDGVPWQQKMDRELGPLVPSYTPPQGQAPSASGQAAWEASLPPGKPFYRTYRDGTSSLEFKPWR